MTPSPNVKITRDGAVLCVTFDRPDKKNALNRAMYVAATDALRQADGDQSIGAVVFTGSGGVFTAGNDIADFLEESAEPGEFPAFTFIKTLAACETPLVAAIEGMAIGIGATMILHCDLVYVAPGTVFRLPFVDLCLVPEAASSLLFPRRIGVAKAAEFLLLGEAFGAEEAVRLGLANAIVPECELRGFAIESAARFATKPRAAIAATRRLMRGDSQEILVRIEEEARLFSAAMRSNEARAAFAAFLGKER
ncbi:MAG TPA: enoyl-CoA hydratase-related protein [Methylocella sp.]|jgi:enoyl-CoA hydratase/carnithine racemase|nr:enoyl-CoA hydratase-related protein [Methylocella sp.]